MSDVEKLVKKWSKDDLIAFVVAHSRDDAESLEMWRLQRELKVAGAEAQSLRERQESALEVLDAELVEDDPFALPMRRLGLPAPRRTLPMQQRRK